MLIIANERPVEGFLSRAITQDLYFRKMTVVIVLGRNWRKGARV